VYRYLEEPWYYNLAAGSHVVETNASEGDIPR
jgi:hypothetical protein